MLDTGISPLRLSRSRTADRNIGAFICNLIYIMPPYYMRFLHSNSTLHWPSIVRRLIRLPSIVIRHRFKWKLSICLNMQRIHDLLCRTVGSTARASVYSNSEFQKESTKRSREEFAVCNAPEHPEAWGCRFSKRIAPNCVHPFPWSLKRQTSCPFESAFYHREKRKRTAK